MMGNMGGMMWGMVLFWLLVITVLVLAAAAFVKYLFLQRLSPSEQVALESDLGVRHPDSPDGLL